MIIDGSKFEGGGQILRTALALSAITGKSFKIINIRKGRNVPGLKNQHLTCIKAFYLLFHSRDKLPNIGDTELEFFPKKIKKTNIEIDIGTAGSITLLMQCILPALIFGNKKVNLSIKGGTDVNWSPSIDYFSHVFLPHISKFVDKIDFKLNKRGYYPKGGGEVNLILKSDREFESRKSDRIILDKIQNLLQIKGVAHASSDLQETNVSDRITQGCKSALSKLNVPINIRSEYRETFSSGAGLTLWSLYGDDEIDFQNPIILGSDLLGDKKMKSEELGSLASKNLIDLMNQNYPVDPFLADQLIPYLALFGGRIMTSKISNHLRANIYTCEKFLGKVFDVEKTIISVK